MERKSDPKHVGDLVKMYDLEVHKGKESETPATQDGPDTSAEGDPLSDVRASQEGHRCCKFHGSGSA